MRAFAGLFVAALAFVGCFTSVRLDSPPTRPEALALDLSIQVIPADPADVSMRSAASSLADNFRLTALFSRVTLGHDSTADLTAIVRSAVGVGRCGTPRILSLWTLGLMPGRTRYIHYYDFDLLLPSGDSIRFDQGYGGEELFGLWAVPARLSAHWSRIPRNHAPIAVVRQLRADLAGLVTATQGPRWRPTRPTGARAASGH